MSATDAPVRFLVIEGNTLESRSRLKADYGVTAGENYGETLLAIAGNGASYDIINAADADASLPHNAALSDYDGVVLTGSSLTLWENEPESLRQVELARAVFRAQVPFFGSCWAIQVAAVAAGGVVHKNPRGREIGYARKITLTDAGRSHPFLTGRPAVYDAPCTHLDEVATLPPDATLLASNAVSTVQAAEIRFEGGTFWGVQYHPEFRHSMTAYLIENRRTALLREGFFAGDDDHAAYVADLKTLDQNPDDKALAWRHGLGTDVTDESQRTLEIRNFIEHRVKPHHAKRKG